MAFKTPGRADVGHPDASKVTRRTGPQIRHYNDRVLCVAAIMFSLKTRTAIHGGNGKEAKRPGWVPEVIKHASPNDTRTLQDVMTRAGF